MCDVVASSSVDGVVEAYGYAPGAELVTVDVGGAAVAGFGHAGVSRRVLWAPALGGGLESVHAVVDDAGTPVAKDVALVVSELLGLTVGSTWLVDGAVGLAVAFGVSELVIGLTLVAAGTSLPEVAASLTAAFRGERDIAVGNVLGSNVFNLLSVLG
jgi:hypothetical protein